MQDIKAGVLKDLKNKLFLDSSSVKIKNNKCVRNNTVTTINSLGRITISDKPLPVKFYTLGNQYCLYYLCKTFCVCICVCGKIPK
jgi:hypothetical protein